MKGNLSGIKRALRSRLVAKSKANSQTGKERDLLTGYDREYDPKMGHFYTCPACYRRYVSSDDVEEHLNTCSMQFMPEEKSSATPTILSVSSLSKASTLSQASSSEDGRDFTSVLVRMLNDNDTKVVRSGLEACSGLISGQDSGLINAGDSRQIQTEDSGLINRQDSGLINGHDSGLIDADEILRVQSNPSDQLEADTEHLMPFAFQQYFNNHHSEEYQADQQQIQSHSISVIPEARINQASSLCSSNQTLYQLNGRRSDEEDMDFDYRDPNIESSYGGFNCPTCDGYFETIEGLQSHVTICISSPAVIPSQPIPSQPLISLPPSTPVMTYFETTGWTQMFPCIPCKKAFKSTLELGAHNMSTHVPSDLKCGVCHKVFSSKSTLAHHAVIHSDDKPYQCRICPMAFKHRSTLKSHSLTHEETPAARCTFPGCGLTFRSLHTLKRHRRAHPDRAPMKVQRESSIAHPEGLIVHPEGASNARHPEGASKEPQLGQAYKPAVKKKPTRRPRRRRSESPDPPSPVEVITIE